MCGIHYDIKKLASMLITTENDGFEVLKQLDQAIQNSRKQKIRLVGVPWSKEVDIGRLVNRPESLDWVSLVHPRPQQWERICALIGAPLQSVSIRKYAINEIITMADLRSYNSFSIGRSRIERSIKKHILKELAPLIKKLSPPSRNVSCRISEHFGYLQTLDDESIFRVCFNTWRILYSLGGQRYSVPYARYFFRPEFPSLPEQPTRVWEVSVSNFRFKAPETLSLWLYRAEFWRCYLRLLGHLKTLNDALLMDYTWGEYYNRLPEDAISPRYDPIGLSIEPTEPNILTVILPQRHAKITKNSVLSSLTMKSRVHGFSTLDGEIDSRWMPMNGSVRKTISFEKTYDEQINNTACRIFDDLYVKKHH